MEKKRILFASDLDNTLIHSYKRKKEGDICIERKNGKEQSFLSPKILHILQKFGKDVDFIPVTSRSIEQYERIEWPEGVQPNFAVVSNGGWALYKDGRKMRWLSPAEPFAADQISGLLPQSYKAKEVDQTYHYLLCDSEEEALLLAKAISCDRQAVASGRKVYLLPEGIEKGLAVKRLKETCHYDLIISAGDSDLDFSMVSQADIFLNATPNFEDVLEKLL